MCPVAHCRIGGIGVVRIVEDRAAAPCRQRGPLAVKVVVAGTFGPIHDGHRALLEEALQRGDDGLVVGLTSDEFADATRDREVPPFDARKRALRQEFDRIDRRDRDVEIHEIDDEYGVADEDPTLDAIVVSTETADAVEAVNRRRRVKGMQPLEAIEVPLVRAADGERISSTRVVAGEIDEHGDPGG